MATATLIAAQEILAGIPIEFSSPAAALAPGIALTSKIATNSGVSALMDPELATGAGWSVAVAVAAIFCSISGSRSIDQINNPLIQLPELQCLLQLFPWFQASSVAPTAAVLGVLALGGGVSVPVVILAHVRFLISEEGYPALSNQPWLNHGLHTKLAA